MLETSQRPAAWPGSPGRPADLEAELGGRMSERSCYHGCEGRTAPRCWTREDLCPRRRKPGAEPKGDQAKPKGKGKGKGKGPSAPPFPPPSPASPPPPVMDGPDFPQPDPRLKAQRVVDWQPIRQTSRLQGSVWESVHKGIEDLGSTFHGTGALDTSAFNSAFMRAQDEESVQDVANPSQSKKAAQKAPLVRVLRKPLNADVLHHNLKRFRLTRLSKLHFAVGGSRKREEGKPQRAQKQQKGSDSNSDSGSGSPGSDCDSPRDSETDCEEPPPLHEEALQTLLSLYQETEGSEQQLLHRDAIQDSPLLLAPSEELLRDLITEVGPLNILKGRAEALLHIARFPALAREVEEQLRLGIDAADAVVSSTSLPMLLQTVLLAGNYVNAASTSLGAALGVTLDSLAKLANVRCLRPEKAAAGGKLESDSTALSLILRQLEETHGSEVLPTLVSELECCRLARSVDAKLLEADVAKLKAQLSQLEKRAAAAPLDIGSSEPPWLQPKHLGKFLKDAKPQIETLQVLVVKLETATVKMRTYVAEPPTQPLKQMLTSLALFLDQLPKPEVKKLQMTPPGSPRVPKVRRRSLGGSPPARGPRSSLGGSPPARVPQGPKVRRRSLGGSPPATDPKDLKGGCPGGIGGSPTPVRNRSLGGSPEGICGGSDQPPPVAPPGPLVDVPKLNLMVPECPHQTRHDSASAWPAFFSTGEAMEVRSFHSMECERGHVLARTNAWCTGTCDVCSTKVEVGDAIRRCRKCPEEWWVCLKCSGGLAEEKDLDNLIADSLAIVQTVDRNDASLRKDPTLSTEGTTKPLAEPQISGETNGPCEKPDAHPLAPANEASNAEAEASGSCSTRRRSWPLTGVEKQERSTLYFKKVIEELQAKTVQTQ